jgi:hypothetical protein
MRSANRTLALPAQPYVEFAADVERRIPALKKGMPGSESTSFLSRHCAGCLQRQFF